MWDRTSPDFAIFTAILLGLAILGETLIADHPVGPKPWRRRLMNIAFGGLGLLVVRAILPLSLVGIRELVQLHFSGLLGTFSNSEALQIGLYCLSMDFVIYGQHRLFHEVSLFWRFHAVHHADTGIDVSSAFRFHPGELLISFVIKAAVVMLLGPPVGAIILFEALIVWASMWSHWNVRVPTSIERGLRQVAITPRLHLVHHSELGPESQTNYGNFLIFWDKLFGTYLPESAQGPCPRVGLVELESDEKRQGFWYQLLRFPFQARRR